MLWKRGEGAGNAMQVLYVAKDVEEMTEKVHTDLGHYGKTATMEKMQKLYVVPKELTSRIESTLDACIPCQLHKTKPPTVPTLHPYDYKDPFECWGIDFVGPLVGTPSGNQYLITAIDFNTSKALAYPLSARSADSAVELLEEIVWTYGRPKQFVTDNGMEFRSDKFLAAAKRYDIDLKRTSPGHPQTNGKVERLNHELVQRLQRLSVNDTSNWDLYLRQALFAFHAHTNRRLGCSPFYLQHGVEPILPSTSTYHEKPLSNVERLETQEERRQHVQDLRKYRTDAANKYKESITKMADARDDGNFSTPISPGDLVMREVLNRKTKLHPKWDGPFVVLDSTDKDTYQLATANGYTIRNLVNGVRLRRLTSDERGEYASEFWEASARLRSHDERAARENLLHDVEIKLRQATTDHLEAQKARADPSEHMQRIAELSKKKREVTRELDTSREAPIPTASDTEPPRGLNKRIRRLPWKLRQS